jgi:hypothetical protein
MDNKSFNGEQKTSRSRHEHVARLYRPQTENNELY